MSTKTISKPGPKPTPTTLPRFPSLRSAMWLYCLAVAGGAAIVLPLAYNIDIGVLVFATVVFTNAGFTMLAALLIRVRLSTLFGPPPKIISLILAFLSGLTAAFPAVWLQLVIYRYLTGTIGPLPLPVANRAEPWSIAVQLILLIPITQGLLFWGYLQRALESIGRMRGAIL